MYFKQKKASNVFLSFRRRQSSIAQNSGRRTATINNLNDERYE